MAGKISFARLLEELLFVIYRDNLSKHQSLAAQELMKSGMSCYLPLEHWVGQNDVAKIEATMVHWSQYVNHVLLYEDMTILYDVSSAKKAELLIRGGADVYLRASCAHTPYDVLERNVRGRIEEQVSSSDSEGEREELKIAEEVRKITQIFEKARMPKTESPHKHFSEELDGDPIKIEGRKVMRFFKGC
eukprot:Nk52_evm21s263 gene=Nk52_evmTU21s263